LFGAVQQKGGVGMQEEELNRALESLKKAQQKLAVQASILVGNAI